MANLYVQIEVPKEAALARGEVRAGHMAIPLDAEKLADLDQDERAALARACTEGAEIPYEFPWRSSGSRDVESASSPRIRGCESSAWEDIRLRLSELAEHERKRREKREAEEEFASWLRGAPDAELVVKGDTGSPGSRWRMRTDLPSGDDLRDRALAEAKRRNRIDWDEYQEQLLEESVDNHIHRTTDGDWSPLSNVSVSPSNSWPNPVRERAHAECKRRNAREREDLMMRTATFIEEHGTKDQLARWHEGVLPEKELRDLVHSVVFAPTAGFPSRARLEDGDIDHDEDDCDYPSVIIKLEKRVELDDAEYETLTKIREAAKQIEGATVTTQTHGAHCRSCGSSAYVSSARVTVERLGMKLSRELEL